MSFFGKLKFVYRMMADPEIDELYRMAKQGALSWAAHPSLQWWLREAAFLHAHSLEQARAAGMKVGKNPRVEPCVIFMGADRITIGDDFVCSFGATLRAVDAEIKIGNQVSVGPFAAIIAANHGLDPSRPIQEQPHKSEPVVIEDDVWIAAGAIVLPGVTMKRGSVLAAGAVLSEDLPEMAVAAGVPAKVIGKRGELELKKKFYGR